MLEIKIVLQIIIADPGILKFYEAAYPIYRRGLALPSSATRKPKYQFHQIYNFLKEI